MILRYTRYVFCTVVSNFGGWTRAVTTSNMEFFMKIVIVPKLVAFATKTSALVAFLVLHPPANSTWRRIHHSLTHFYLKHVCHPVTSLSTKTISYLGQSFYSENIYKLEIFCKNKVLNTSFKNCTFNPKLNIKKLII